jgi:di/tricarboxylate transporter
MKQLERPRYWQLDVFVVALLALAVALMRAHLPAGWAVSAEIAWSSLALLGMGLWVSGG